ncbi:MULTISPECIES: BPTD_3080 family restriction endonuclease [Dehalococcoides]|uniref:Type III restriction endonuclease subunit R n=2 Tax=root TaxID=1 RepID=A0AB33HQB4_9CHLR|nr:MULTISPECIES: DEAD/DEAH box helicase family protein [Dehalococcoides]MEA4878878.1 DEAD/DEAH box helicase family protein [Dehalococcoides mccartyi]POZ59490.1 Type III restriction-modification enzyme, helicase subunit [Dehalococcoides mccartyi]BAZ97473.1 type III restriction endonuclease subunit R [Dehalococcoides mccartyi]
MQVVIENPILNSPFQEPTRHFRFSDEGITNDVVYTRRISSYFIPIAKPKKKGKSAQLAFDTEWTRDRIEENEFINRIRGRVSVWRKGNYEGITKTTRHLLEYWTNPERERKLFFCQIEALETAIYLTEVANKYGDSWIENSLRQFNADANPELFRIAFKMATGSGKTVVMAMLIAWHVLNKQSNPQDVRFSDTFLIVTPGITIRDRLRVLLPNDPQNYYRQRDILPPEWMEDLGKAKIIITNFHAFKPRELVNAGKLTKDILSKGQNNSFTETPDQMVRRVCRELGNKKNIIVINDEAHHCYRRRVDGDDINLTGEEKKEAEKRDEEARVWISGLEAVKAKIGVKATYDLSATPFFLRGSGYPEGTLFPWVVSDFSLIDAIECGIVKVPRVPVSDDSMINDLPTYRNIWALIRDHLPKKGRGSKDESGGEPKLPKELEGALYSLYGNYEKYYRKWEQNEESRAKGQTPPVFIVVCNNTNVSKLVYDWISGWGKKLPDDSNIIVPGNLPVFRNSDDGGNWLSTPNTILIDSEQLESGEAMSKEFKKMAALAIEEFKRDYSIRFPGRDAEKLTDEDLLREVMNTVGKPGKLGENVKCVVSVSMLTEGWDANTVTHIMGVRAFGTQLLCEQVVGRGLRRMSYVPNNEGKFDPEYAEVYGVPFSFIPCSGSAIDPKPGPMPTRVRSLEERITSEITFPRLIGYRYDLPRERLTANFNEDSQMSLSTSDIPTKTENAPIVGETSIHTLDELKNHREQEVAFLLAKLTLDKYFRDDEGNDKPWLFPQLVGIARQWLQTCVTLKDNTFPQLLLLIEFTHDAADRIYKAIIASQDGPKHLKPILRPYDNIGSTRYVDFDTTRPVYSTDPKKCHVSHVVADTESWEQKMAQALEEMNEVICYVKNQNLNFTIPYTLDGEDRNYIPDFIVRVKDGNDDPLNLIIEVTGEKKKDKAAKVATARTLWVPAVNNHGSFGRWAFLEISDPWDAKNTVRTFVKGVNNATRP